VLGKPFTCGRSQGFDEVEIVVSRKGRTVPQVGGQQWQLGFDVSAFPIPAHERIYREAVSKIVDTRELVSADLRRPQQRQV
jgi:hypothetical protein